MLTFVKDPGGHSSGYVKDPGGCGGKTLDSDLDPGGWSSLFGPGGGMGKNNSFDPGTGV
ncbi:hypothetical protein [Bacillus pseudomycoides]|uniref:hypothetical protein n=1 Tax=Bacillus pseudomycoides TaxID=64104 RepID=UPI00159B9901|nr:hypothetical protein [Bacillus pseudomycoides]